MVRGITLSFYGVPRKSANLFLDFHHRWALTSTSMSAISDIRHRHLLFWYRRQICRTEKRHSYIYRKYSDIDIRAHSDIRHWRKKIFQSADANPRPSDWKASTNTELLRLCVHNWMSDIGYRIKLYSESDIISDSTLSVRYRKFRYQAQSDIADHGYRTKCPPMIFVRARLTHLCQKAKKSHETVPLDLSLTCVKIFVNSEFHANFI